MALHTKEGNRRTGSLMAPIKYFLLESTIVLLVVYMLTGGDIFSQHGLIMSILGLVYPLSKLPKFLKRAQLSNQYTALNRRYA